MVHPFRQSNLIKQISRGQLCVLVTRKFECNFNIFDCCSALQQMKSLKYESDIPSPECCFFVLAQRTEFFPEELNGTSRRPLESRQQA